MKNTITTPTLDQWLANQAIQFDLAVTHFNSELQKAGFTCLSHALAQRGKSKEFFIEFFTQNRIIWDEEHFKKASFDEIKHELELAFKFCDAYLKKHSKQEVLVSSDPITQTDEMYIIKPSAQTQTQTNEVKKLPLKPFIEQTVLKEGTRYIRKVPVAA